MKLRGMPKNQSVVVAFTLAFAAAGWTHANNETEAADAGEEDTTAEVNAEGANSGTGVEEEEKAAPQMRGLELIPVGKTNKGVRLPLYNATSGDLEFIFKIGELTPVDTARENLDMVDVDIEVLGKAEDDSDKMNIDLINANYHTVLGILSTDEEAIIRRSDFILIGETMDFDTKRGLGRMTGKTKMTIYNFQRKRTESTPTQSETVPEDQTTPLPRMNIR
ncbi:MAG: hypothetical protein AAGJ79_02580 [Verrucomicrobiota bacterium]